MADDDLDLEPELPVLPVQPVTVQHPALGGDIQGEIDHRTADPADEPGRFSRVFHIGGLGFGRPDHPVHLANAAETLGDAIRRGLHPKGDVHLVDVTETDERREKRTSLTYAVDVVPAVVDHDAASTITPSDVAAAARIQWIGESGPELTKFAGAGTVVPSSQTRQAPTNAPKED